MYIYKTIIYHDTTDVVTVPASNTADLADFDVAGKGGACLSINELNVAETAFILEKTYTDFDDLITGGITWGSVKCVDDGHAYLLYLVTTSQL